MDNTLDDIGLGSALQQPSRRTAVADLPRLADPVQLPLSEPPRTATTKVQRVGPARRLSEGKERAA
ncbi:hypothetical protein [Streptomyces africanus]|uniref:hypothetical protein n=1 Tax=Streptomyces africanus TaxID=231024 RepID=UPI000A39F1DA|nr:hypothetical protein [Streptomyces africanus]